MDALQHTVVVRWKHSQGKLTQRGYLMLQWSDGSTAAYSSGQMTPQSREVDTERLFDAAVVRWKHCSIQ